LKLSAEGSFRRGGGMRAVKPSVVSKSLPDSCEAASNSSSATPAEASDAEHGDEPLL
jgi:hypothetical protein